jgi:hypothetical protein
MIKTFLSYIIILRGKADLQIAINEAIKAADVLSDKLYILENFLDDASENAVLCARDCTEGADLV